MGEAACSASPRRGAMGPADVGLDARHAHQVEVGERLGAHPPTDVYDIADALVTLRLALRDAEEAFGVAADRAAGAIKVIIVV